MLMKFSFLRHKFSDSPSGKRYDYRCHFVLLSAMAELRYWLVDNKKHPIDLTHTVKQKNA
jgi:hypothetical protein